VTVRCPVILAAALLWSCIEDAPLYPLTEVSAELSGVRFRNDLAENDDFNIVEYLYFYNGGGVAAGDINNDGLPDLYFSSNRSPNRLYLNKGGWRFEDITDRAGVAGEGNWKTGVSMADVNGDGWLDIFSCGVGGYKSYAGRNALYINNGDQTFTDRTEEYGLSFRGFTTQAAFFDYDNDGDLDMYLLNHSVHSVRSQGDLSLRYQSDPAAGDRLFRNDRDAGGRTRFVDVTSQAGIFSSAVGYGLGIAVSDFNGDGFADLYISNDFQENDYLYINNGNGTFMQQLERCMPHSSRFSMGSDVADLNHDGWPEIFTLDMLPWKEELLKASAGEDPFETLQYKLSLGFHYQVARNALQLNRGAGPDGSLSFSDVAPFAGVEATDWSWGALFADLNQDGNSELLVTNGILRRPNDLDYINFISGDSAQRNLGTLDFVRIMPDGAVPNKLFFNRGGLAFADSSERWMDSRPGYSMGSAYADLDTDGDLDLIVNNLNAEATLLKNDLQPKGSFLKLRLRGAGANSSGIGTRATVWKNGVVLGWRELSPVRGWQSSSEPVLHFGLGRTETVDSVVVLWPGNRKQTLRNVQTNTSIEVVQEISDPVKSMPVAPALFTALNLSDFIHRENPTASFEGERLIPRAMDTQGPALAAGDLNRDGLIDVFLGGGPGQPAQVLVQKRDGSFLPVSPSWLSSESEREITHAVIGDFDGDQFPDLMYAVGDARPADAAVEHLALYLSRSSDRFVRAASAFPKIGNDPSSLSVSDFDQDGDSDLFVGVCAVRGSYGTDPESMLLVNDGKGRFTAASGKLPGGGRLGMLTGASWCDLNEDARPDLIVVGEWMPITLLVQNASGVFEDQSEVYGLSQTQGWWNSVFATDLDNDGATDMVAGNLGLNSRLRASITQPVRLYVADLDANGSTEPVITYYNEGVPYPFSGKDQLVRQVPSLKKKFLRYDAFARVRIEDLIPDFGGTVQKRAVTFASAVFMRRGAEFRQIQLPAEAQWFPIVSASDADVDQDGNKDLIAVGNLYDVQPEYGRYDAGYGLVLSGQGDGTFCAVNNSGFHVPGQGRGMRWVRDNRGNELLFVARNKATLLTFKLNSLSAK
jgi:hypothetical protein